jgi:polysaccharide export outer membrane protein
MSERFVHVTGAVNKPKAIDFREGLTVLAAILEADGFTKFAKQNDVVIFRKEGGKDIAIKVRAKDLIQDGKLSENVPLRPGDYVVVKEGFF